MKYVRFGSTDLEVSRICLGSAAFAGDLGSISDADSELVVRRGLHCGVNFFDTAQAYGFGRAERVIGRALRGVPRDRVVIATKGGQVRRDAGMARDCSEPVLRAGLEASLTALGTEYVDLYFVHWPDPRTPMDALASTLDRFVREGKVRYVGVSNFSRQEVERLASVRAVDAVQPPLSLMRRDAEEDLIPYCALHRLGVACYGALAHGLLARAQRPKTYAPDDWRATSDVFAGEGHERNARVVADLARLAAELGATLPQLAVAWTLTVPGVHAAIVGARDPTQLAETVTAPEIQLSHKDLAAIHAIAAGASPIGGPTPEGRALEARGQ